MDVKVNNPLVDQPVISTVQPSSATVDPEKIRASSLVKRLSILLAMLSFVVLVPGACAYAYRNWRHFPAHYSDFQAACAKDYDEIQSFCDSVKASMQKCTSVFAECYQEWKMIHYSQTQSEIAVLCLGWLLAMCVATCGFMANWLDSQLCSLAFTSCSLINMVAAFSAALCFLHPVTWCMFTLLYITNTFIGWKLQARQGLQPVQANSLPSLQMEVKQRLSSQSHCDAVGGLVA